MDTVIPVGTLVRVLPSSLEFAAPFSSSNKETVALHGWLYFVVGNEDVNVSNPSLSDPYECRSLATGQSSLAWLHEEIEAAEEQDDG